MKTFAETLRRLALVAIALGISAVILRPQLASSLVIRGDDFAYRGNLQRAREMYQRAMWVNSDDGTAVDRYAFSALLSHEPHLLRAGVATASRYLAGHQDDATVLMDRGLLLQTLHNYAQAEGDFARVGALTHDARALTFAGFNALHAGDHRDARAYFARASAIDPSFIPAKRGLARS